MSTLHDNLSIITQKSSDIKRLDEQCKADKFCLDLFEQISDSKSSLFKKLIKCAHEGKNTYSYSNDKLRLLPVYYIVRELNKLFSIRKDVSMNTFKFAVNDFIHDTNSIIISWS